VTQLKTIVERTRVKHNELIIIGRGTGITGGLTCGGFMIATAAGSSLRGKMFFIRILKGASVKSGPTAASMPGEAFSHVCG
jgi:hypothetical protein